MRSSRSLRVYGIALLVAMVGCALSLPRLTFGLEENAGLRWLLAVRGPRPAPPEAVIVRFDRDALARLRALPADPAGWPQPLAGCVARHGPIPFLAEATRMDRLPRGVPACLVEELTRRGAAVVAFDISLRRDRSREAGIPALAAAIHAHGRVILLDLAQRQLATTAPAAGTGRTAVQADWLEGPHPALAAAAIATASFTLPRVSSDIHQFWTLSPALPSPTQLPLRALEVLTLPALIRLAEAIGEPLPAELPAAEALSRFTGWLRAQVMAEDGAIMDSDLARVSVEDGRAIRALADAYRGPEARYLNVYGPPGTFTSISAADLLIPDGGLHIDDAALRGRVVFVGFQELAIPQAPDSFSTTFVTESGVAMAGVEIAATAFANLLHTETLRALPEWARLVLVGLLAFALTLASCLGTVWRGLALTLSLGATYAGLAVASFMLAGLWLPLPIPLLVLLPLAIGLGQAVRYLGAARWLGVYAPRQVSRRLLQGRDLGAGPAEMREVTVMLTDIVGFTTMAEQSTPAAVTDFINRHFTMLNRCVEAEGGTLAQFIGDSVMSFWGAPDPLPDHAARACRVALAVAAALEAENAQRAGAGLEPVRMRIGINTGLVTAGNVGAPGRSNYGIVGDTVNTTQRIEQLAKTLCPDQPIAAILVSARTRDLAGPGFAFGEAGAHEVRGRREPVMIYRLQAARVRAASAAPAGHRAPARATAHG